MIYVLESKRLGSICIRNLRMKLSRISNKLMMLIVIICLMLYIQVTAKGFGPISKIFDMTFQT